MLPNNFTDLSVYIRDQSVNHCESTKIPGYLAGVYHNGKQAIVAHGVANIATGEPMREHTGFLFGSITKILTTMLILQQVERGTLDLDEPVTTYLPEFKLAAPSKADNVCARNLLNHTNGIDADLLFVDSRGADALKIFLKELAQYCGTLFKANEYISYSNGGMIVAGRLLEVITGKSYHNLLKSSLYETIGMRDSSTSAEEAILRSTSVGHFFDPAINGPRRTDMFMLPESWAPAGGTPIGTIHDLLALGQTHLNSGLSPIGKQVLSNESILQMQSVSYDMNTPNAPPIGLGWMLMPFGKTTVLSHSGASPGGAAILTIVPEHNFIFTAFGNDPRAMALHDQLLTGILQNYLNVKVPEIVSEIIPVNDLTPYTGTYCSNQLRVDVSVADGQLEERITYEPLDDVQRSIFTKFAGGTFPIPPRRFVPIGKDLFAPAGMPLASFSGYARNLLVSYHDFSDGQAKYRSAGGRMTRRQEPGIDV
jgi:CubicO group peptidase (beta-lactamase class C family)